MTAPAGGPLPAAADPSLAVLADHAGRAIARQAARIDEHRSRAATLFSAASISAAFLSAETFKSGTSPGPWAWVGAALFALTGLTLVYIIWPPTWRFMIDVRAALTRVHAEGLSVDQTNEAVAVGLSQNYADNEPRLGVMTKALTAMGLLVVGEIVALFINLAVR